MSLGDRLKSCRMILGYSAEQVAEKLGVSPATMYRYENGDIAKMPAKFIEPLSAILSTTPEYLMGWTDEGTPIPAYTETEQRLVSAYRLAEPKYQEIALELLEEHPAKKEPSADQTA